jgi:hypothetical protein
MGGKQLGFGDYQQTTARKRTKRERFLGQMQAVVRSRPGEWCKSLGTSTPATPGLNAQLRHPTQQLALQGVGHPANSAPMALDSWGPRVGRPVTLV